MRQLKNPAQDMLAQVHMHTHTFFPPFAVTSSLPFAALLVSSCHLHYLLSGRCAAGAGLEVDNARDMVPALLMCVLSVT